MAKQQCCLATPPIPSGLTGRVFKEAHAQWRHVESVRAEGDDRQTLDGDSESLPKKLVVDVPVPLWKKGSGYIVHHPLSPN